MSANDNAPAAIVYTVSISTGAETASCDVALDGIRADVATADVVEAFLNRILDIMDLLLENQVSFAEIASLVRASKAMPTGGVPLYALSINREELLLEMFKDSPLMPKADSPAHGLDLLRKAHPSVVDLADRAAAVAIQRIGEMITAQMSAPEGKPSGKPH